eukprot:4741125-Pyramimonas_sp.AAC.1
MPSIVFRRGSVWLVRNSLTAKPGLFSVAVLADPSSTPCTPHCHSDTSGSKTSCRTALDNVERKV